MPVPGAHHDAHACYVSGLYELVSESNCILGDKGYQAHANISPTRKLQAGN